MVEMYGVRSRKNGRMFYGGDIFNNLSPEYLYDSYEAAEELVKWMRSWMSVEAAPDWVTSWKLNPEDAFEIVTYRVGITETHSVTV